MRHRIGIVGAGAAGALTALHLAEQARRRGTPIEVVLLDEAPEPGRGVAFGTTDPRHLLNVPAAGMSALPDRPGHFAQWRARQGLGTDPAAYAPRREFGRYLGETLRAAVRDAGDLVRLRHEPWRVVASSADDGVRLAAADGRTLRVDAAVIATGVAAPGEDWAPPALAGSARFVADPWAPGALDVVRRERGRHPDVLLVGTGLTMVDLVLTLAGPGGRPDRVVHAVSRSGRLPARHVAGLVPEAVPDVTDWGCTHAGIRVRAVEHIERAGRAPGGWRSGVDGLRHRVSELWQRLDDAERRSFLATDAATWSLHRHRMAPSSAATLRALRRAARLRIGAAGVTAVQAVPDGLRVRLADGRLLTVGHVVNCTGPRPDLRTLGDPFLDDLLRPRGAAALAVAGWGGMGLRTRHGRLVDGAGRADAPLWTLGALRRGELWESTAVPEIRRQAADLAEDVLTHLAPASPAELPTLGVAAPRAAGVD